MRLQKPFVLAYGLAEELQSPLAILQLVVSDRQKQVHIGLVLRVTLLQPLQVLDRFTHPIQIQIADAAQVQCLCMVGLRHQHPLELFAGLFQPILLVQRLAAQKATVQILL